MGKCKQIELKLVRPEFDSELNSAILELNHLKKREICGSTLPIVFFQVKDIFHYLESLASTRIEGNHTTISELVDDKLAKKKGKESQLEIWNVAKALEFIDEHIDSKPITQSFIREMHKVIVKDLSPDREGCRHPGEYRTSQVSITGSGHIPPGHQEVQSLMQELSDFINNDDREQFDLIKAAMAHHRFVWIHPFENGNGRTVRMLTYAMLVKLGFNVNECRLLNPAAIFCNDREEYYDKLATADAGTNQAYLKWCEYVISGLAVEINKIDRLLDYGYLRKTILVPAMNFIVRRKEITPVELKVAIELAKKQIAKSSDLAHLFKGVTPAARSQVLARMIKKKLLRKVPEKRAHYALEMTEGPLLRGIINSLRDNGFVPEALD